MSKKLIPWENLPLYFGCISALIFQLLQRLSCLIPFPCPLWWATKPIAVDAGATLYVHWKPFCLAPMDWRCKRCHHGHPPWAQNLEGNVTAGWCQWLQLCCHGSMAGDYPVIEFNCRVMSRVPSPWLHLVSGWGWISINKCEECLWASMLFVKAAAGSWGMLQQEMRQ